MSEPIPVDAVPDVVAARALVALVELLHADPAARVLSEPRHHGIYVPSYSLFRSGLRLKPPTDGLGIEQLAAARAVFGDGEVTIEPGLNPDYEKHTLRTTWQGVRLEVVVEVSREDELTALRKENADLRAAQASPGALAEQRHQLFDPAVPPLAVREETPAQASTAGAVAL